MDARVIVVGAADVPAVRQTAVRAGAFAISPQIGRAVAGRVELRDYYTFPGANFYGRAAGHAVLRWDSRAAFADILYRHLYTAEQMAQFRAYLAVAYNGARTDAEDAALRDGRFDAWGACGADACVVAEHACR